MKVGYVVLYKDGTLTISKKHTILQKPIYKDYGEFDDDNVSWKEDSKKIKIVQIVDQVKSNCMKEWFDNCCNLTTLINFQNLDVSDCENFVNLFFNCVDLVDILSLKSWNVSNGKKFDGMFCHCSSLEDISVLKNWDMSNGKDFYYMFGNCKSLRNIFALKDWDVSNGKDFYSMFKACKSLINISILSNWNVSNGKDFRTMFGDCINLRKIQLPNTLKSLNYQIFIGCSPMLQILWKDKIYIYDDLKEYQKF